MLTWGCSFHGSMTILICPWHLVVSFWSLVNVNNIDSEIYQCTTSASFLLSFLSITNTVLKNIIFFSRFCFSFLVHFKNMYLPGLIKQISVKKSFYWWAYNLKCLLSVQIFFVVVQTFLHNVKLSCITLVCVTLTYGFVETLKIVSLNAFWPVTWLSCRHFSCAMTISNVFTSSWETIVKW